MISTVNGIQVEPPTEASSPANSISIPPDVPNAIALKNAIIQGNIGAVEALIESGVDVNSEFPGEGTALQIALQVKQPQTECVDLLLDHGADIYKKGGNDQNALVIAVVEELNDVLDLMVQGGYVRNEADLPEDQRLVFDLTILHIAVCCWNQQALKRLLESPARGMINYQGLHGQTPLHFTTKTDQEAVGILALVMHDRWEVPPIRAMDCDEVHCHEVRKCEIAQLLVDNGARGDIRDRKGSTALMKCFGSPGTYEIAKIIFSSCFSHSASAGPWTNTMGDSRSHLLITEDAFRAITNIEIQPVFQESPVFGIDSSGHYIDIFGRPISNQGSSWDSSATAVDKQPQLTISDQNNEARTFSRSRPTVNQILLFPSLFKDVQNIDIEERAILLLCENQHFISNQLGIFSCPGGFSCGWWRRSPNLGFRSGRRWVLQHDSTPRPLDFQRLENSEWFVACRFTTTSASLYEGYGEIKLEPRIHAVLWIMAKSFSSQRNNLARARPESTRFVTTFPYGALPQSVSSLFHPLVQVAKTEWTVFFEMANHHLSQMHLTILESRGNNHSIIDQLLRDALLWVKAEGMAKTQIQDLINLDDMYALERLPHDKGHDEVAMAQFEDSVRELDSYLIDSIKHLRQTSKELIELEFNLTSISEAQKSTSTSVSMKRLSWITFIFLPLTFVSSLFGMNVNVLESNPPWWIYLPFAFSTLGLTMVVWLTFKRYPSIEDKAERVFRKLAR